MFARVITFQGKPDQVDVGIRNQREQNELTEFASHLLTR